MTSAIRLRLLIAVDTPQIVGYDQDEFARRLYYDRPIEASIEAFKAARRTTAEILERMSEAEWAREGTHSEHGRYTSPVARDLRVARPQACRADSRRARFRAQEVDRRQIGARFTQRR